jgi:hypothetical protein
MGHSRTFWDILNLASRASWWRREPVRRRIGAAQSSAQANAGRAPRTSYLCAFVRKIERIRAKTSAEFAKTPQNRRKKFCIPPGLS